MDEIECECSEEYGACEEHSEVLAQRDGSSARTADELSLVFLWDALDIIRDASPDVFTQELAQRVSIKATHYAEACEWSGNRGKGIGWMEDADDAEALHDDVTMVETWLPANVHATWDDGYVIRKVTGGPFFSE